MELPRPKSLNQPQRDRLEQFDVSHCVDVHCHCLAGLDDGPETWRQSISLCQKLVEDGITVAIATPHQLGRYHRFNSAAAIRQAVAALNAKLAEQQIPLDILPGADVRMDEQLLPLLDAGEVMTIADLGKHLLLELPHELFVDPRPLIDAMLRRGVRPIMTHPERYAYLRGRGDLIASWADRGALIQITAGSLLGDFGLSARTMAIDLVLSDIVALVATDAHDAHHRVPRLSAVIDLLATRVAKDYAKRVCLVNPMIIAAGQDLES